MQTDLPAKTFLAITAIAIAMLPGVSSAAAKPPNLLSFAALNAHNYSQSDAVKILGSKAAADLSGFGGWNPSIKNLAAANTPDAKRQLELKAMSGTFGNCSPSLFTNPYREVDGLSYSRTDSKSFVVAILSTAVQTLSARALAASSIIPNSCFYNWIPQQLTGGGINGTFIGREVLTNQKLPPNAYAQLLKLSVFMSGQTLPATAIIISAGKTTTITNYLMLFVQLTKTPGPITYANFLPLLESVVSKKVSALS